MGFVNNTDSASDPVQSPDSYMGALLASLIAFVYSLRTAILPFLFIYNKQYSHLDFPPCVTLPQGR